MLIRSQDKTALVKFENIVGVCRMHREVEDILF